MKALYILLLLSISIFARGQSTVTGQVKHDEQPVPGATVEIEVLKKGTVTDAAGYFTINELPTGKYKLRISAVGYVTNETALNLLDTFQTMVINMNTNSHEIGEVVVTGTMKEVSRMNSPVPVEIISSKLFRKNPTPSLFEAVGMVNGVKPQLNCNVCNTGDIHINGMEGPYTMVLIDGMPIVSSLATVYGLSGIPNSIVDRIEIVKGPASSLYGTEAMGGIINVITKNATKAPAFSADVFATSWGEISADLGARINAGKASGLLGINYFNYQQPVDKNSDNFTDVTLQRRISLFNKWNLQRKENRQASLGLRYVYEDRWGGQMQWEKKWRGSDSIYGESIYTRRVEAIGTYQLPTKEKIMTQFSYNWHDQNSYYGITPYMATQQVGFAQAYWDKSLGNKHSLLLGASVRYINYDDNTTATSKNNGNNMPSIITLPGIFLQDEWTLHQNHTLLAGYRYDYNKHHGRIHSPRLAYKWTPNTNNTLRASFGTGFRVVNLFTEDHAALTGAREVVIEEELKPERSYNSNLNYVTKIIAEDFWMNIDVTGFYSYFTNKIIPDYLSDPNKIIYDNLNGYAVSRGISLNTDFNFMFPLRVTAGVTYVDVYNAEENNIGNMERSQQLFAPRWSGTFVASYNFSKNLSADLTGNWYGPMRLPIQPNDYRPEYSPLYCLANIQLTKRWLNGIELYGGVKNLFDFVPKDPIMRPHDPFDKYANDVSSNPNGYTFDPSYNYAPLQGIRGFAGLRYTIQ